jgi:hypothetical protein
VEQLHERTANGVISPDSDAVWRGKIELVPWLDVENRIPCIEIAHGICAEFVGRMYVGHDLLPEHGGIRLRRVALRPGEEKLLVARKPIHDWRCFSNVGPQAFT